MALPHTAFSLLFERLSDTQARAVLDRMTARELARGQGLFAQGDPSPRLWVIRAGRLRTYHLAPSGEEFTTAVWTSGQTLGLLSTLLDQPRAISCEALEPASLLAMERADLLALMEAVPVFAINVARVPDVARLARLYSDGY